MVFAYVFIKFWDKEESRRPRRSKCPFRPSGFGRRDEVDERKVLLQPVPLFRSMEAKAFNCIFCNFGKLDFFVVVVLLVRSSEWTHFDLGQDVPHELFQGLCEDRS